MAYKCHGDCNAEMVQALKAHKFIRSELVESAMLAVDRGSYAPSEAYTDRPIRIGFGATISAPHMHAIALERCMEAIEAALPDCSILDVGSGSGYLTACFAVMAGQKGKVTGIEHIPELVELAERNVKKSNGNLLDVKRLEFIVGDGREGFPLNGPYDVIHVGAAAKSVPQALLDQLKPGGSLIIPVGSSKLGQLLRQIDKTVDGEIKESELTAVRFVPLTGVEEQMTGRNYICNEYRGSGHIDMLNDDTLLHILNFLMLNQWLVAELVCTRWHDLLRTHWKKVDVASLTSLMGVPQRYRIDIHPLRYTQRSLSLHRLQALSARCGPSLRRLETGISTFTLDRIHLNIGLDCLVHVGGLFPNLQTLDLSGCFFIPAGALLEGQGEVTMTEVSEQLNGLHLPHVTRLVLQSCFDDSSLSMYSIESAENVLSQLISASPAVTELCLGYNMLINGSCLLACNPETLVKLDLSFCRRADTATLGVGFSHLVNLQSLCLYSNDKLLGSCLEYLPATLQEIDLSYCNTISADTLATFFEGHQTLRVLKLCHVRSLNNTVLKSLCENLTSLRSLVLSRYFANAFFETAVFSVHQHDISEGLEGSLKKLSALTDLDLTRNEYLTDAALRSICLNCSSLQSLTLAFVPDLTEAGYDPISCLKSLRRLDVSGNEEISLNTLVGIAHSTELCSLEMRQCPNITADIVTELKDQWPVGREITMQMY